MGIGSRVLIVFAILLGLGFYDPVEAAVRKARVLPTPSWVKPIVVDYQSSVDASMARGGTSALLRDVRIRIGRTTVERYERTVAKAVSQAGVEALAEPLIEFAPEYQELALHRVAVIRNGKVFDQTARASIRMLEQESDLEHRVYRGTASALVVLSDVRPGDVVDLAYSIRGQNPVLAGHYAGSVTLGGNAPTRRFYVEVRRDESRDKTLKWAVRGKAPPPIESDVGKEHVLCWNLGPISASPDEDRIPASHDVPAELQLSELQGWVDVVDWARGLYPEAGSRAMADKGAELRAGTSNLKESVLRAIRFVQDDVRYLSQSLGPFSLRPHAPAQVLKQRFGDCKDKSYLLVELLRVLGVEAYPALANTDFREQTGDLLPSAFDFDHAIVKVILDGRSYFVDPTWAHQGGSLDTEEFPSLGRVLVISPTSQGLETVPEPAWTESPHSAVNEFVVAADGAATLHVITTYRGSVADGMRAKIASTAASEMSHEYANYYEKDFGKLTEVSPLDIQDDRIGDVIVISEKYAMAQFWKEGERTLLPDSLRGYLHPPSVTRRESPLSLDHPTWIREVHKIKLPFSPELERTEDKFDDPAFTFRQLVESNGKEASATYEYRSRTAMVTVPNLEAHLKRLDEARDKVGLTLEKPSDDAATDVRVGDSKASKILSNVVIGAWLLGGIVMVPTIFVLERILRRRRLARRVEAPDGGTPAKPLHAATIEDARARLSQSRCSCGSITFNEPSEFSPIRYGAETLHVGGAACASCGVKCRLYFAIARAPNAV